MRFGLKAAVLLGAAMCCATTWSPLRPSAQSGGLFMGSADDQRSPLAERWGGWFVTGSSGGARHFGNRVPTLEGHPAGGVPTVAGLFDPDGYRAMSSDIAALLTFSHQTHMTNLLTRASWEARVADSALHPPSQAVPDHARLVEAMMSGVAAEVVDSALPLVVAPRSAGRRRDIEGHEA